MNGSGRYDLTAHYSVGESTTMISDTSSELSSPPMSRAPSVFDYPLQSSSRTSPAPGSSQSSCPSSNELDGPPPAKKRRLTHRMPRDTKHLDLDDFAAQSNPELERLTKALRTKRKIVVVAGAGISVSAGIPDFRSTSGLFNTLRNEHNLKGSGKQLFDAAVYRDEASTSSFHEMVRSLSTLTKFAKPTPFHHLLARLAREGRLLRLYSQNVDGIDTSLKPLETEVPLPLRGPWPRTVQLHGGLGKMTCTKCHRLADFCPELFDGPIPPFCTHCEEADHVRTEVAGKRSHGIGKLRPRMVLYNEHNPDDEAIGAVTRADMRTRPDAVIVVGTSLKVPGVKRIVREMCNIVRDRRDGLAVWINNDPEPSGKEFENCWDLIVKGTCDEVAKYAGLRRWDDDDIGEWKQCSQEEVKEVAETAQPQVIVISPSKAKNFRLAEDQPIPLLLDTSHALGISTNELCGKISEQASASVPHKLVNPASHGPSICELLKGTRIACEPKTGRKPSIGKKPKRNNGLVSTLCSNRQAKSVKSKPGKTHIQGANNRINFKVSKGSNNTITKSAATGESSKSHKPQTTQLTVPDVNSTSSVAVPSPKKPSKAVSPRKKAAGAKSCRSKKGSRRQDQVLAAKSHNPVRFPNLQNSKQQTLSFIASEPV